MEKTYLLQNKKTKNFFKPIHYKPYYEEVDSIFKAHKIYSLNHALVLLKEFRCKSKFKIVELIIDLKEIII